MILAEFREDVRVVIPTTVECLKDSHSDVRKAVIEGFSTLAVQGMCQHHFPVVMLKHVLS